MKDFQREDWICFGLWGTNINISKNNGGQCYLYITAHLKCQVSWSSYVCSVTDMFPYINYDLALYSYSAKTEPVFTVIFWNWWIYFQIGSSQICFICFGYHIYCECTVYHRKILQYQRKNNHTCENVQYSTYLILIVLNRILWKKCL